MSYPTPHIAARPEDFAKTVLMPGDPKRSRFVAETYLKDPVLVNDVRGVQGYTGEYNGKRVSVMASGMGIPSIGIYSYELYNFFGVENIIRIGSAGAISEQLQLRDIVIGMGACTNSAFASQFSLPGTFAPIASFDLASAAVQKAREMGVRHKVGNILSADTFYDDDKDALDKWKRMGVLAVEMESAGLYLNAARAGKNALCICTISDLIYDPGVQCTPEERQVSFNDMMKIALEIAQ
ncbi:MAG: purine-nucleoside phosphorylase [Clostridia bacterium]|nr:purine-nucleoside phosphorylase [Clostridia bacterium]